MKDIEKELSELKTNIGNIHTSIRNWEWLLYVKPIISIIDKLYNVVKKLDKMHNV